MNQEDKGEKELMAKRKTKGVDAPPIQRKHLLFKVVTEKGSNIDCICHNSTGERTIRKTIKSVQSTNCQCKLKGKSQKIVDRVNVAWRDLRGLK